MDKDVVTADPAKTQALLELSLPSNEKEMCHFVGMVNQLVKFLPQCAEIICPLTELLSTKQTWQWGTLKRKLLLRSSNF